MANFNFNRKDGKLASNLKAKIGVASFAPAQAHHLIPVEAFNSKCLTQKFMKDGNILRVFWM